MDFAKHQLYYFYLIVIPERLIPHHILDTLIRSRESALIIELQKVSYTIISNSSRILLSITSI